MIMMTTTTTAALDSVQILPNTEIPRARDILLDKLLSDEPAEALGPYGPLMLRLAVPIRLNAGDLALGQLLPIPPVHAI